MGKVCVMHGMHACGVWACCMHSPTCPLCERMACANGLEAEHMRPVQASQRASFPIAALSPPALLYTYTALPCKPCLFCPLLIITRRAPPKVLHPDRLDIVSSCPAPTRVLACPLLIYRDSCIIILPQPTHYTGACLLRVGLYVQCHTRERLSQGGAQLTDGRACLACDREPGLCHSHRTHAGEAGRRACGREGRRRPEHA